jgi:signal peptidase II
MSCCGINNPYSFNVADVWIFGGALFLVLAHESGKSAKA